MRKFIFTALKLDEFCEVQQNVPCPVIVPPPPPAKIYKKVSVAYIESKIPHTVPNIYNDKLWAVRTDFWDCEYGLTTKEEIEKYLVWDRLDEEKYVKDDFDCNRFAVSLWGRVPLWTNGICFGLILTGNHAMNWFLDKDGVRWTVEPQSDYTKVQREDSLAYHYFL